MKYKKIKKNKKMGEGVGDQNRKIENRRIQKDQNKNQKRIQKSSEGIFHFLIFRLITTDGAF